MKQIFKLIPVALGLLTLASCSNEDFLGENNDVQYGANDLEVKLGEITDEESGTTRAALYKFTEDDREIVFDNEDKIRVYDENFGQYDLYTFGSGKFTKTAGKGVTAKWGLFPSKYVKYGNYDVETEKTTAVVEIPEVITYDESSEVAYKEDVAYVSEIPFFGEATMAGEGADAHLATTLNALTALYKIQLNTVKGSYKWMKISSETMPLSGLFEATLNDPKPALTASDNLATKKYIIVDLKSVPSSRSIIYVPVIPGTYPANDFKVQFSNADDWTAADAWTTPADQNKTYTAGVTFTVRSIKPLTRSFSVASMTCEALTRQLNSDKNMIGAVEYSVTNLPINRNEDESDFTVYVPNMKASSLKINLATLTDNISDGQTLYLQDADAADAYDKTVVLNIGTITNVGSLTPIEVNMPNSNIVLVGNYEGCNNITIKAAKSLTFGDGTTMTTVPNDVTTDQNHSTYVSTIKESITVTAKATLGKAFTIVGANTGKNNTFNVNIEGVTKAIVARYSDVKVSGNGQIGGTLYAAGNVTVESSQNTAISNLQYSGTGKILNLMSGGISVIKTTDYTSGTPAVPDKLNTLTITNLESGKTQIGDIKDYQTIGGEPTKVLNVTFEKSVWCGEATTSTSMKNPAKIYTASQFASLTTVDAPTDGYTLMTNIDLNHKDWAGVSIDKSFDGNGKTISNVNVTGEGNVKGGLFQEVTFADGIEIKNLTVKDVYTTNLASLTTTTGGTSTTSYPDVVGALVAVANVTASTTDAKITNVKIDAAEKDLGTGFVATTYVGGLIGKVTGTGKLKIAGKSDTEKGTVTLQSIKGHAYLGGLIGGITEAATIDIKNYTVTLANGFTVNKPTTIDTDYSYDEYGTVGMYIGQAKGTISYDADNANNSINGNRGDAKLGFVYNHKTEGTTPAILYRYFGGNINIGYSPNIIALTVGSTPATAVTTQYLTKTAYNALAAAAKLNPNIFIKSSDYSTLDQ